MPASRTELMTMLETLGIETRTVEHPPLFTVADSQALRGDLPGGHTKNLFLKDKKGALFLIVAEENAVVDLKTMHKRIGSARLSFGKPDLLMEKLGIPPGSVTPFGMINDKEKDVTLFIDTSLAEFDIVNCHPLDNSATTAIAPADLVRFIEATGHNVQWLDIAAPLD